MWLEAVCVLSSGLHLRTCFELFLCESEFGGYANTPSSTWSSLRASRPKCNLTSNETLDAIRIHVVIFTLSLPVNENLHALHLDNDVNMHPFWNPPLRLSLRPSLLHEPISFRCLRSLDQRSFCRSRRNQLTVPSRLLQLLQALEHRCCPLLIYGALPPRLQSSGRETPKLLRHGCAGSHRL